MVTMKFVLASVLSCVCVLIMHAQPITNPYVFSFPAEIDIDSGLVQKSEPITENQRLRLVNGHLSTDTKRVRLVGTNFEWGTMFPDSARAEGLAKRLQALGINCVRFSTFDYTFWDGGSILAPGTSSVGGGLNLEQMKKFDYLTWQLAKHGIYYTFTFGSAWQPRQDDGIPDSTGFGARIVQFFNPNAKRIHREIIRLLLSHTNEYSGYQYKNDPALAYVVAGDDASLIVYYAYTKAVVTSNIYGDDLYQGEIHRRKIDTIYNTWLTKKYGTNAAVENAWKVVITDTSNRLLNSGFEDAFSPAWQFAVNAEGGTQALFEYNSTDKHSGTQSGRVRINAVATSPQANNIYITQPLPRLTKNKLFRFSVWLKTTGVTSRKVQFLSRLNIQPYSGSGIQSEFTITPEWREYTQEFLATADQENSSDLIIGFGGEMGDVWIDDISVKEIARSGLNPGESITNNTVQRTSLFDTQITRSRQRDNALFSHAVLSEYYSDIYKLIRDTLESKVLLCPSSRNISTLELDAAKMYDVFSFMNYAYNDNSNVIQAYGGELTNMSSNKLDGKAFVVNYYGVQASRPYHSELLTTLPAYASMQDWDGIMFGAFTSGAVGNVRLDSNQNWLIYDKPNILALLPLTSRIFQEAHVKPTTKKLLITHSKVSLEFPGDHLNPFWLRNYTDPRIPLFRTVSSKVEPEEVGSLLPHLEISALANDVPLGVYDAENNQLFMNSNDQTLKVQTSRSITISGVLAGKIFTTPTTIIEQTNQTPHAVIALTSKDSLALDSTSSMLVSLVSRPDAEGSTYGANGQMETWGRGLTRLDGISARINFRNSYDSCVIQPLGSNGKAKGVASRIGKNASGRFVLNFDTKRDETPLYVVSFANIPTGIDEQGVEYSAGPNPCNDVFRISYPNLQHVQVTDILGNVVANIPTASPYFLQTQNLASGEYILRLQSGTRYVTIPLHVLH